MVLTRLVGLAVCFLAVVTTLAVVLTVVVAAFWVVVVVEGLTVVVVVVVVVGRLVVVVITSRGFSVLDFGSKSMTTGLGGELFDGVKEFEVSLPDMALGVLTEAFSMAMDRICCKKIIMTLIKRIFFYKLR